MNEALLLVAAMSCGMIKGAESREQRGRRNRAAQGSTGGTGRGRLFGVSISPLGGDEARVVTITIANYGEKEFRVHFFFSPGCSHATLWRNQKYITEKTPNALAPHKS